jgi:hypothetical protein
MCRGALESKKIVWANAKVCKSLVSSDVPVHTAVSIPACSIGDDFCVVILLSVSAIQMCTKAIQYICTVMSCLPFYEHLSTSFQLLRITASSDSDSIMTSSPREGTLKTIPSWVTLNIQDMNLLLAQSKSVDSSLDCSWRYLRESELWNPSSDIGQLDGKASYTLLRERYHEVMMGMLQLTQYEICELWLTDDANDADGSHLLPGKLTVVAAFHTDAALQPWATFTRLIYLSNGMDFPGQVVQSARPLSDPSYGLHSLHDGLYPRAPYARELGIACAYGVPIPLSTGVCGSLVFYSRAIVDLNPQVATLIAASAYLLAGSTMSVHPSVSFTPQEAMAGLSLPGVSDIHQLHSLQDMSLTNSSSLTEESELVLSYEADTKSLIDYSLGNALELLCTNSDSTGERAPDILSSFPDGGRKRRRGLSRSNSFGSHSGDESGSDVCRRCTRPLNDRSSNFCINCVPTIQSSSMLLLSYPELAPSPFVTQPSHIPGTSSSIPSHLLSSPLDNWPSFCMPIRAPGSGMMGTEQKVETHHQFISYNKEDQKNQSATTIPLVKKCKYPDCTSTPILRSPYCAAHAGSRKCQQEGCSKCAQGSTKYCISHGGGRRCTYPGCNKGARDKFFCAGHGGGKRCVVDTCNRSAVGSSPYCTNHGGGKRCKEPGCQKSAQSSTPYCVRHGGGRKCLVDGCPKVE